MTDKPNTENKAALPDIYRGGVGNAIFCFGVVMFLVFVVSAYVIAEYRATKPVAAISLGAIWVVGVPVFFFLEHVVLFRRYGDPSQYDQFKRLQELGGKVWAGAIVVLAAFFAQTFPK
jgi:hypothetical protein